MVGLVCLTLRSVIGEPSDWNCSSYFLPLLSVAAHEMLATCRAAKFPSCLQYPADNSTERTGKAVDLRPLLGAQQHAVDRQLVQVILRSLAIFTRERHDVAVVRRVVERDREVDAALFAMEEPDDPACKIAARDFERRALARHQGIDVDVRVVRFNCVGDENYRRTKRLGNEAVAKQAWQPRGSGRTAASSYPVEE